MGSRQRMSPAQNSLRSPCGALHAVLTKRVLERVELGSRDSREPAFRAYCHALLCGRPARHTRCAHGSAFAPLCVLLRNLETR